MSFFPPLNFVMQPARYNGFRCPCGPQGVWTNYPPPHPGFCPIGRSASSRNPLQIRIMGDSQNNCRALFLWVPHISGENQNEHPSLDARRTDLHLGIWAPEKAKLTTWSKTPSPWGSSGGTRLAKVSGEIWVWLHSFAVGGRSPVTPPPRDRFRPFLSGQFSTVIFSF